ncbi:hypothetical protein EDB86DRAFT_3103804 [Lactarius hatsudake]|nr:hypothetical protein EDB86DRAFT_3103804 [Lactarius hatsudake]
MRTIHLLVILLVLTPGNGAAVPLRVSTKDRLLLTPLNGWGSSDAKKCVRTVNRARLSWEAEIQKIDPHDENI